MEECVRCKELEAENARLREGNTYMWKAKYEALEQQLASLRLQTTECNGFDCCPLAPELAELSKHAHAMAASVGCTSKAFRDYWDYVEQQESSDE